MSLTSIFSTGGVREWYLPSMLFCLSAQPVMAPLGTPSRALAHSDHPCPPRQVPFALVGRVPFSRPCGNAMRSRRRSVLKLAQDTASITVRPTSASWDATPSRDGEGPPASLCRLHLGTMDQQKFRDRLLKAIHAYLFQHPSHHHLISLHPSPFLLYTSAVCRPCCLLPLILQTNNPLRHPPTLQH